MIVGLKIGLKPFIQIPFAFTFTLDFVEEAFLAAIIGLQLTLFSEPLGCWRRVLNPSPHIYFSLDIVAAGTASFLVSIPTVASAFLNIRA